MTPTAEDVRAALERVLASDAFANAGRHSQLLRYLVERTLAGDADQLKEYVLGVEVFGRPATYDPRLDSIVRVEARRLRARLSEYYRGPGAGDPVVIDVPRGAYIPVFTAAPEPPVAVRPSSAERPAGHSRLWATLMGAAAILGLVVAIGWQSQVTPTDSSAAPVPAPAPGVGVAVLPFAVYSTEPEVVLQAARLTDGVTTALARYEALSVVSRTSAAQFVSEDHPVTEVAQMLGAELIMEGTVIAEHGRLKVSARLVDGVRDRKVWVGEYTGTSADISALEARIAADAGPAAMKIGAARQAP